MLDPLLISVKKPDIEPHHFQEWLDSGVDPDIIRLNVRSLDGTSEFSPIDFLAQSVEKNKTHAFSGLPKTVLDRYRHTDSGGWLVLGDNGNNEEKWGCFKPDRPYSYSEVKKGFDPETPLVKTKVIKYEHPKGVNTGIFCLAVPDHIWQRIAQRYDTYPYCNLPSEDDLHTPLINNSLLDQGCVSGSQFWDWVIENNIPVVFTEGVKKAGALLTAGYAAIALPGIFSGYRQPKNELGNKIGFRYLIPPLLPFAAKGREINFCFDNDPKIKTRLNVRKAIEKTGNLFSSAGCDVKVIQWNDPFKGVDDLIVAKGQDYFEAVYNSRITLSEYKLNSFLDLSPYVDLTINERFIPEKLEIPSNTKLFWLKALHGTGKTEYLARKIQESLNRGQKVLILVHREQLARELARRFGIDYRTELKTSETGGIFGYALCVDSLHPNANPPFNPEDWEDAIVIIDEVEQVLWHLLEGGTCRQNRTKILKTFKNLLQTVACSELGKIFLADSDLSPISINYLEQLIGFKVPKFGVINTYIPNNSRKLFKFSGKDPSQLVSRLTSNLRKGEKALIHTDGQKHQSKWGTRNTEAWVKRNFPDLKVLRIDRQTVKDKNHPAFNCVDNLNQVLVNYDVVICSPVIETGVSIDIKHFDGVYVLSHGVQTVNSVVQTMQRNRDNIPRYVWCKPFSTNRIGNGSYDFKTLLSSQNQLASANISALQRLGVTEINELSFLEEGLDCRSSSPSLIAWGKKACLINYQNSHFSDSVFKKCEAIGYKIIEDSEDEDKAIAISKDFGEIRENNYKEYREQVSSSESIGDLELENLKEKQKKGLTTEQEDLTLEKAIISRLYATEEVSPELVQKHDKGWFPKLQLLYYLAYGNEFLPKKEQKTLEKLKEQGEGEVFKPDFNRSSLGLKIFTLQALGTERFLDPNKEFSSESEKDWFKSINNPLTKFQIKSILGFSIGEKDTAIGVIQRILATIDLKLTFSRQETMNGKRVRVYKPCQISDQQLGIFSRWFTRDSQSEEQGKAA